MKLAVYLVTRRFTKLRSNLNCKSYLYRRRGKVTASELAEFMVRRGDNGAKFGCVDPDRLEDGVGVGSSSSEELELRVLCKWSRDLGDEIKGVPKVCGGKKLVRH